MSEGFWELNKPLELSEIAKNSFSVISVSSVVNHSGIGVFKNPQDRGKIHAVLGQILRFLGRVEFQLHVPNVCRICSLVNVTSINAPTERRSPSAPTSSVPKTHGATAPPRLREALAGSAVGSP
jgi:hypothetical protein